MKTAACSKLVGKLNYQQNIFFSIYFLFVYCIKQLTHCKLCLPKRVFIIFTIYFTKSFALPLDPFFRLIQIRSFKLVLCFVNYLWKKASVFINDYDESLTKSIIQAIPFEACLVDLDKMYVVDNARVWKLLHQTV